jgi:hypothetical protein
MKLFKVAAALAVVSVALPALARPPYHHHHPRQWHHDRHWHHHR